MSFLSRFARIERPEVEVLASIPTYGSNSRGLLARLTGIKNTCHEFLGVIERELGAYDDVSDALDRLDDRITRKLFESFTVYAYSGEKIFMRMSISIDWEKHRMMIDNGDDLVYVGDAKLPDDAKDFVGNSLSGFLKRSRLAMRVTNVRVEYQPSSLALAAFGRSEVFRMAGWEPVSPRDAAQRGSFRAIHTGLQITPQAMREVSMTVTVGISAPIR